MQDREAPQERCYLGCRRSQGRRHWCRRRGVVSGPRRRQALHAVAGGRVAVGDPASDPTAVARASREYLRKYQSSPYAQAMVRSEVLPTTLRLEPG